MARPIRRLAAIVLALGMAATLFLAAGAPASARPGPSNTTRSGAPAADDSQDESGSAIAGVTKLADPDTSSTWRDFLGAGEQDGSYSTANAGRIWVDGSVYSDEASADAAGMAAGSFKDPENDFLVSISAIAQAASIHQQDGGGHDVVFVVSLNGVLGSMTYAERPYADYVVSALNSAIGRLMAENDAGAKPTRVAVIGYSSETTVLMPLATYRPAADGTYLSYDASEHAVNVTANVADGSAAATADARLKSGSYLQRGIYLAGDMLSRAGAAGAQGRSPELIVMGVENPPMANTDIEKPPAYTGNLEGFLGPLPNAHETGYGTDSMFATMLTMRLVQQRVDDAYAQGGDQLTIYTTGIDTTDAVAYLLDTAEGQAARDLTATVGGSPVDLKENLAQAARAYARATGQDDPTVTLELFGSGGSGIVAEPVKLPAIKGILDEGDPATLSCVHRYYSSRSASAVNWAFASALDEMFDVRYTSPVDADDALAGGARIEAHSAVGTGMEVASIAGVQYGDTLLTGSLAAQAIERSLKDPGDLSGATHEFDYLIKSINERYHLGYDAYKLFYDAMEDGQVSYDPASGAFSNRVSWYIDADHRMVAGDNGLPYRFASQREIDAVTTGSADAQAQQSIEQARAAGARAVCETYLYIGNLPNFYTGGDVALYDFYIAVETDLDTRDQTVYLSIPSDAVPALRTDVTLRANGDASMSIDGAQGLSPLRFVFEVAPRKELDDAIERVRSGEATTRGDVEAALGAAGYEDATGSLAATALLVEGAGSGAQAKTIVTGAAASGNSAYVLAQDQPLYTVASGAQPPSGTLPDPGDLTPLTRAPRAGETLYYMTTAYRATFADGSGTASAEAYSAVHPYQVAEEENPSWHIGDDGSYELDAGTPASSSETATVQTAKTANATGTATYSQSLTGARTDGRLVLSAALGNDGSYRFETEQKEPEPGEPGTEDPDPEEPETPGPEEPGTEDPDPDTPETPDPEKPGTDDPDPETPDPETPDPEEPDPEEPETPDPEEPESPDPEGPDDPDPSTPLDPDEGTGSDPGDQPPSTETGTGTGSSAHDDEDAPGTSETLAGTGDSSGSALAAMLGIAGVTACAAGIVLHLRRK
ncbi:vWA domain-containing protein [Enorma phocaeensis]|uniref:vWA domain-containing protein n=1 Tax=Enorma phocaeensis TaxID=1871019 RepID=UPI0019594A83|nr:vWA domain-containing protein [Enorma phocaeensis]MBM6952627.1 VWA domain-containing protein [Enorma phocaeensis]